jgi:hypothetical protein
MNTVSLGRYFQAFGESKSIFIYSSSSSGYFGLTPWTIRAGVRRLGSLTLPNISVDC